MLLQSFNRFSVLILILVFCFLLYFERPSRACACKSHKLPSEAYNKASAVFIGTVKEIKPAKRAYLVYEAKLKSKKSDERESGWKISKQDMHSVTFSVEEAFKSAEKEHIDILTATSWGMCGFPFQVGQKYLVYTTDLQDGIPRNLSLWSKKQLEELSESLIEEVKNYNSKLSSYETSHCQRTRHIYIAENDLDILRKLQRP